MKHEANKKEAVSLRPHHLLCIRRYEGRGYSPEFTAYMDKLTIRLKNEPDLGICLKNGADDVCARCPNLKADGTCTAEEKVLRYDETVRRILADRSGSAPRSASPNTFRSDSSNTPRSDSSSTPRSDSSSTPHSDSSSTLHSASSYTPFSVLSSALEAALTDETFDSICGDCAWAEICHRH